MESIRTEWNGINVVINPFLDCWFIERKSIFAIINKEKNSRNRNKRLLDARKHKNTVRLYLVIDSVCYRRKRYENTPSNLTHKTTATHRFEQKNKMPIQYKHSKKRKERKNQSMNQFVKQFYRCANTRQPINMDWLVNEHRITIDAKGNPSTAMCDNL